MEIPKSVLLKLDERLEKLESQIKADIGEYNAVLAERQRLCPHKNIYASNGETDGSYYITKASRVCGDCGLQEIGAMPDCGFLLHRKAGEVLDSEVKYHELKNTPLQITKDYRGFAGYVKTKKR